jgi:hypothetical protein
MRKDVSRRKALSLLGTALSVALVLTDAEAQTAGTKSHHTKHPKRPTVQPAAAPAAGGPTLHENPNGTSAIQHQMEEQYRQY